MGTFLGGVSGREVVSEAKKKKKKESSQTKTTTSSVRTDTETARKPANIRYDNYPIDGALERAQAQWGVSETGVLTGKTTSASASTAQSSTLTSSSSDLLEGAAAFVKSAQKESAERDLAVRTQELEDLRAKRAQIVQSMLSTGLGTNTGLGAGMAPKDAAEMKQLAELKADIEQKEEELKALETEFYGYGDNVLENAARRVGKTITGTAKSVAADVEETLGQLRSTKGNSGTGGNLGGWGSYERMSAPTKTREELAAEQRALKEALFQKSDELSEAAADDLNVAKSGLSALGKMSVDLGSEGTKLVGDLAANLIMPGAGTAGMLIRAFGSGAREARHAGATATQQVLYGATIGGVEALTERMFAAAGPLRKAYGAAAKFGGKSLDDLLGAAIRKLTSNATIQKLASSFISEGLEEIVSDIANPFAKLIYDGGDALRTKYTTAEGFTDALAEELYDGLLGGLLGGFGGSVDLATTGASNVVVGQRVIDSQTNFGVVELGLNYAEGSESRKIAEEIAAKLNAADDLTRSGVKASDYGRLVRAMQTETEARPTLNSKPSRQVVTETGQTVTQMSAVAEAFRAKGDDAATAVRKAQVLERMMASEAVSNKQLDALGLREQSTQAVLTELTGVEVPKGATNSELQKIFRSAAETASEARQATQNLGQVVAQAQDVIGTAQTENEARAEEAAAQVMAAAQQAVAAENEQDSGILFEDGTSVNREDFREFVQDYFAQRGESVTAEQADALYDRLKQYNAENGPVSGSLMGKLATEPSASSDLEGFTSDTAQAFSIEDAPGADVDAGTSSTEAMSPGTVTQEQEWTARYVQAALKNTGVRSVVFDGEHLGSANAMVADGVIYLNEKRLSEQHMIVWAVGHELVHPGAKADAQLADTIIGAFQTMSESGALGEVMQYQVENLDALIAERTSAYKRFLVQERGKTPEQADATVTEAYVREEIAANWMGYVFETQNTLERLAGVEPSLLTKALRAVRKIREGGATELLNGGKTAADAEKRLAGLEQRLKSALLWADTASENATRAPARPNPESIDTAGKTDYNKVASQAEASPELQSVIDRLAKGENVPTDAIDSVPEVQEIRALPKMDTSQIHTQEREQLRAQIAQRLYQMGSYSSKDGDYTGEVAQGRRIDIVIGVPAAGKSSVLVNPLSEQHKSRVIDSDMAKELLPEYDGGKGAGNVHKESSQIRNRVFDSAIENGDNIVWPTVGDNLDKLLSNIQTMRDNGYSVYLHLNELSATKATGRALNRFLTEGRFVDPAIVLRAGDKPTQNYLYIRQQGGLIDGYSRYSNDVARGERPVRIEAGDTGRALEGDHGRGVRQPATSEAQETGRYSLDNSDNAEGSDYQRREDVGRTGEERRDWGTTDQRDARGGSDRSGNLAVFDRKLTPEARATATAHNVPDLGVAETTDYAVFSQALDTARTANRNGAMVDPQSVAGLAESGARTFLNPDGTAGIAVERDGNIVGVFKNPSNQTPKASYDLLLNAIANGGNHLDCYVIQPDVSASNLGHIYSALGFEPVAYLRFNREYADPNWDYASFGEPDVVMWVHNGDSVETVAENIGNYHYYTPKEIRETCPEFTDYDEAKAYQLEQLNTRQTAQASEDAGAVSDSGVSDSGDLLYVDEEKSQTLFGDAGVKSTAGLNNTDFDGIEAQSQNAVKSAPDERFSLDEPTKEKLTSIFDSEDFQGFLNDFYAGYSSTNTDMTVSTDGQRVSRVRSNTLEQTRREHAARVLGGERGEAISRILTLDEKQMDALDEANFTYDVETEKQSMARAKERLANDYTGTKAELENSVWHSGEDLDAAMGILAAELADARKSGNYDAAIEWTHLIQEQGTGAGQFIHAFAKYSRSPEGVLVRAAETLDAAGIDPTLRDDLLDRIADFTKTLGAIQRGNEKSKEALIDLIVKQAKQRHTRVSKTTLKNLNFQKVEYLYDAALNQMDQIAQDYVKASAGKKISTYQTMSHLLNLRTANRNVVSNQIFDLVDSFANNVSLLPDAVMSAFTGRRTVGFEKSWVSKGKRHGAAEGLRRAWIEAALDINPDAVNSRDKYGTARRTWKMTGNKGAQAMSTLEKMMGFELNVTDEFHKGSVAGEVTESLARAVERGDITQAEAEEWARQEALYRSFQDDTFVGGLLGNLKSVFNTIGFGHTGKKMGKLEIKEFGLGDFVQKYTQVPGALITRAVEFSPVGYAKAIYCLAKFSSANKTAKQSAAAAVQAQAEADANSERARLARRAFRAKETAAQAQTDANKAQRMAALALGRASTGTGLIAAFAALAAQGLLKRADDEDDADAKALKAAEGISGTQLNTSALARWIQGESTEWQDGDELISIEFLEPLNALMTMGALVAKDNTGATFWEKVRNYGGDSMEALYQTITEIPTMQTLQTIQSTVQYHTDDSVLPLWAEIPFEIARGGLTGFVPSLIRQGAQAGDTVYRETYGDRNPFTQAKSSVQNSVPGWRNTLDPKLDNFGQPKQLENTARNIMNAFVNPGSARTYRQSSVSKELDRVYGEIGKANIYPDRSAPYTTSFTKDNETVKFSLTAEERQQYQKTRGQTTYTLMQQAMADPLYKYAASDEKSEFLTEIKNYANYVAKKEFLGTKGEDYADKAYEKYTEALDVGLTLSAYLAVRSACSELESDKDANGKAIKNSLARKQADLIDSYDLTPEQKEFLFHCETTSTLSITWS